MHISTRRGEKTTLTLMLLDYLELWSNWNLLQIIRHIWKH